ncbi:hypothetical protein WISP_130323 [Willisornis vidua]|uniref:Uncharacterized protein n=1 Tax=Willisornis vidua TaxID=1566151 RepID=A0ABQ9CPT0_9PASS|nr:hypothetical protein WISP_130323 [Willisornis vidua]
MAAGGETGSAPRYVNNLNNTLSIKETSKDRTLLFLYLSPHLPTTPVIEVPKLDRLKTFDNPGLLVSKQQPPSSSLCSAMDLQVTYTG